MTYRAGDIEVYGLLGLAESPAELRLLIADLVVELAATMRYGAIPSAADAIAELDFVGLRSAVVDAVDRKVDHEAATQPATTAWAQLHRWH